MKLIDYLFKKFFASKRTTKWAVVGMLCIILGIIGIGISNIQTGEEYSEVLEHSFGIYGFSFLEGPSASLYYIGFILLIPMTLTFIWKIAKLVVYELTFEVSKAIKDGKTTVPKRKKPRERK